MSHAVKIDLRIQDLDALAEACAGLGLELVVDKRTFRRFGGTGRCAHCITLPGKAGAYEIGVVSRGGRGPGYELQLDPWKGGAAGGFRALEERVGPGCVRLKRAYAERAAVRRMASLGYVVAQRRSATGAVGEPVQLAFQRGYIGPRR